MAKKRTLLEGMRLDYDRIYKLASENYDDFQESEPFRHVVIDNFLHEKTYDLIKGEIPLIEEENKDIWSCYESEHTQRKYVTNGMLKELNFTTTMRSFFFEFNSSLFLRFLERLSGMKGVVGDPYFKEGGIHCIKRGGFLDSHIDFSHNPLTGLQRVLNFFIFFNDDWKEEWGGHLTLFDLKGNPVKKILPIGNRCVVFEASEISFHGHPDPLLCPSDRIRTSMAIYYYIAPTGKEKRKIIFQNDL